MITNTNSLLDLISKAEASNKMFSVTYLSESKGGLATLVCLGEYARRSRVLSQHADGTVAKAEVVREIAPDAHLFTLAATRIRKSDGVETAQCRELKLSKLRSLVIGRTTHHIELA